MATQPIAAPKPMIDPKDELISELTGGLKDVRPLVVLCGKYTNYEKLTELLVCLDALIHRGELGVQA